MAKRCVTVTTPCTAKRKFHHHEPIYLLPPLALTERSIKFSTVVVAAVEEERERPREFVGEGMEGGE